MIQHYFLAAWIPGPGETDSFYTRVVDGNRYMLGMRGPVQTVPAGATGDFRTRVYVGPKLPDVLEEIAPNLELTVDYGVLHHHRPAAVLAAEGIHASSATGAGRSSSSPS